MPIISSTPPFAGTQIGDKTIMANWFFGLSNESKITKAIARAVEISAAYVYIPANMLPYDASKVTFNNAVLLIREGGPFDAADVQAYGAAGDNVTDDVASLRAAFATGQAKVYISPPTVKYYSSLPLVVSTDNQAVFGAGFLSRIRFANNLFCGIGLLEGIVRPQLYDFEIQAAMTSSPAGPAPMRGIVVGTNSTGTAHSVGTWNCHAFIRNVHVTGVTPGTNGFNLGIHLNRANKSRIQDCIVESIYGTASSFGYGIACNADDTDLVGCKMLSTIAGQGRHAVYFTNLPYNSRAINCYAEGFQSEAFTSNCAVDGVSGYHLAYINCVAKDCMQTETAGYGAVFSFNNGGRGRIINCKALGAVKGSNSNGVCIGSHDDATVENFYGENINGWGIVVTGSRSTLLNTVLRETSLGIPGTYGGIELQGGDRHRIDGLDITSTNARFVIRCNAGALPTNSSIKNIRKTGSYSFEIENYRLELTNSVELTDNSQRYLVLTDAATIVIAAGNATSFAVTLAGNRAMGTPTFLTVGQEYIFNIIQDAVGGRTLTWPATFKQNWSDVGNTANKRSTIKFVYDGLNMNQVGAQSAYI